MFSYVRASYNQLHDESEIDFPSYSCGHAYLAHHSAIGPLTRKAFVDRADDTDLLTSELADRSGNE